MTPRVDDAGDAGELLEPGAIAERVALERRALEVTTTPRPSCCIVCGGDVQGYATCGAAPCVAELLKRQQRKG